jgi:hypothetical protein
MEFRPPPEPAKLLHQWDAWERGDELPGRTMANLKTGEARMLLEAAGEESAALLAAWTRWEKGQSVPSEVLGALKEAGMRSFLAARVVV